MDRSSPFQIITTSVARMRRRLRTRALIIALGWAVMSSTLGLLSVALLTPSVLPDPWLRVVFLALPIFLAVFSIYRAWWLTVVMTRGDRAVAEYWEEADPTLGDGLISSVQFADEWNSDFRGSREAAGQLARWVEEKVREKDVAELAPMKTARAPWVAALSALVLAGALSFLASERLAAGWSILMDGSQGHTAVSAGPLVGDVTIIVDAPKYSGVQRRLIPNSTGAVSVLRGATVTVTATTLESANRSFLMLDDQEVAAQLDEGRKITASFTVDRAFDWRFGLIRGEGERNMEAKGRRISIRPDKAPVVTLDEPKMDVTLERIAPVPVEFELRDDFGITSANVVVALASDLDHPVKIPQGGISGKTFRGADEIDLRVIDIQPGDRVALYVEAFDNNAIGKPQRGVSATRFLTIRSPEADHYAITDALHGLIETLLSVLANRLEVEIKFKAQSGLVGQLNGLRQQTQEAIEQVQQVVKRMQEDPLTPDDLKEGAKLRVTELDAPLLAEANFLDGLVGQAGLLSEMKIRLISKHNEDVIKGVETLIIFLEAIVARIALEDIAMMTEELKASRQRLRDLISAYKENPDAALKDRILRNIQRLRDRMKALQQRMAKLRQKLPDEFLNIEGMKQGEVAKGLKETRSQLDDIEKMLEDGRIDEALAAVDQMSETLDELSSSLDKDMQKLQDDTNPELQRAISELMDRTRDLTQRQTEVNESTEAEAKQRDEATKEIMNSQMADRLEKIKKDAAALRGLVEEMAGDAWPIFAEDALNSLNQRVTRLVESLDETRLPDALATAEESLRSLRDLEHFARFAKKRQEQTRRVGAGVILDQRIIKDLADLLRDARKQAQASNKQEKMDELQQRQQQISEATRQLRKELQKKSQGMPELGGPPMQSLEDARQSMERAGRDLKKGRPRHARANQDEALNQLKGMMKSLRQAGQPKPSGERQTRRMRHERVKIPGKDDHEAPEAFRKELMDAMKDKAPQDFQESVKRYYEELVK